VSRAATFAAPELMTWADLVACVTGRAALLLERRGGTLAEFECWFNGEVRKYLGRLRWLDGDSAPRVVIYDGRTGEYVCRSKLGDCFAVEPEAWRSDPDADEANREEWRAHARSAIARGEVSSLDVDQVASELARAAAEDEAGLETRGVIAAWRAADSKDGAA